MKFFHDSRLKRIDFLDERFYEIPNEPGNFVPSTTEVISGGYPTSYGLKQWLKSNGFNSDVISERAMASGSRVHEAIDALNHRFTVHWQDAEGKTLYDKREWEMILRYREFVANNKVILLTSEFKFADKELGYGGTIDSVFLFPDTGKILIVDVKTGNEYRNHKLQLIAYFDAWNRQAEVVKQKCQATGCAILYLEAQTRGEAKDGKRIQGNGWKLEEVDDLDYQRKIFQSTYDLWLDNPETPKKPTLYSYPSEIDGLEMEMLMKERMAGTEKRQKKVRKSKKVHSEVAEVTAAEPEKKAPKTKREQKISTKKERKGKSTGKKKSPQISKEKTTANGNTNAGTATLF